MTIFRNARRAAVTMVAAAVAGAGAGAAIRGGASGASTATTTTTAVTSAASLADASGTLTVGRIYRRNKASVVEITVTSTSAATGPFGGPSSTQESQGTGFVIDTDGDIVTNEHVVDGATSITVTLDDGSEYPATLVGADASTDVAVVRIDAPSSKLDPVTFGDSSDVRIGDGVVAIGAPYGLDDTVTTGIVSATGREITAPDDSTISNAIQTDAAINHGNSGGPLFNSSGRVIGVTAQIESESGGNDGIGFAIPSNTVTAVVAELLGDGAGDSGAA